MSTDLFTFERTSPAGGIVRCGGEPVAEIVDLVLVHAAGRPGHPSLIMSSPGTPLYWRQYANHQHPERSAASHAVLHDPEETATSFRITGASATQSRSVLSSVDLRITLDPASGGLDFRVALRLFIDAEEGWRVTPHPHHGELEFCSLWPRDVFHTEPDLRKRFTHCLVDHRSRGDGAVIGILHHHLESDDKHRLAMQPGDRFLWGIEDVNPVVTVLEGRDVEAGLCAYMWDAHLALRVCEDAREITLACGGVWRAAWQLGALSRAEASALHLRAQSVDGGRVLDTPVIERGVQSFARTFRDLDPASAWRAWPWSHVLTFGDADHVSAARSDTVGCGDSCALRITHAGYAVSRWEATALGPAFGEPAFGSGVARRMTAMLRTSNLQGAARIAVRLHREDAPHLYDATQWERFESGALQIADCEWIEVHLDIPAITPRPDRLHMLLEVEGRGTVWFDDVLLVEVT